MKKTAAILFLCVFVFNLYGYRLLINYVQTGKETALVTQLDNDVYTEEELVTIKTPIALPYYTNTVAYDRVDGTIEIDGTEYKYVKRRIYNDSLELLCIPNTAKKEAETARQNFFKLTNEGTPADSNNSASKGIKNVLLAYCDELPHYALALINNTASQPHLRSTSLIPQNVYLQLDHPPERA